MGLAGFGPSEHRVQFDDPRYASMRVKLRRKGNQETPWLVMPGLLHRDTASAAASPGAPPNPTKPRSRDKAAAQHQRPAETLDRLASVSFRGQL